MQRAIIRPQFDAPLTVLLASSPEGVEKAGRYGVDYQYSVNGNEALLYLPLSGRDALMKAGAQSGDLVELVKFKRGSTTLFNAKVLSDAKEPEQPQLAPRKSVPRDFAEQLARESSERRAWATPKTAADGKGISDRASYAQTLPSGQPVRVIAEQQAPPPNNGSSANASEGGDYYAQQYVRCFRSALCAASLCVQEAKRYSYPVAAPTLEDVRTIATTFFIEENRRGNGGAR